jgi:hypothetical protein
MRLWLAALLLSALLVAPASAVPPRQCDPLPHYTVIAHGVRCSFARKWVRRYLKSHAHPKGWTCTSGSGQTNVKVNCQGREKPQGDAQYRYYYGIKR